MSVPFAVHLTGDPTFPHNGDVSTDVTISAPTTWTEADYPGRVVALDRLDVDDVLTLQGGPWFILLETLDFGAAGEVRGDGPSGGAAVTFTTDYARGGVAVSGGRAQGGCGGVMIFICANTITGTASRPISANGGAGYRDTTNAGTATGSGGQGALSPTYNNSDAGERWAGDSVNTDTFKAYLHPLGLHMGGRTGGHGNGGGSGYGNTAAADAGGGSGIGSGGGSGAGGVLPPVTPSVVALIDLALAGCRGGGGGAAAVHTTGANNAAGGGGGGSVVVWCKTLTATPTLSAAGGAAATAGGAGAAGVTYLIDIP